MMRKGPGSIPGAPLNSGGLGMTENKYIEIGKLFNQLKWFEREKDTLEILYKAAQKKEKTVIMYSNSTPASLVLFKLLQESPYRDEIYSSFGSLILEKIQFLNDQTKNVIEAIKIVE